MSPRLRLVSMQPPSSSTMTTTTMTTRDWGMKWRKWRKGKRWQAPSSRKRKKGHLRRQSSRRRLSSKSSSTQRCRWRVSARNFGEAGNNGDTIGRERRRPMMPIPFPRRRPVRYHRRRRLRGFR